MRLKATIQENPDRGGNYPVFYITDTGIKVGPAGELILTGEDRLRIYAPGTWQEVNVCAVDE